jgi:hypothetical protein
MVALAIGTHVYAPTRSTVRRHVAFNSMSRSCLGVPVSQARKVPRPIAEAEGWPTFHAKCPIHSWSKPVRDLIGSRRTEPLQVLTRSGGVGLCLCTFVSRVEVGCPAVLDRGLL